MGSRMGSRTFLFPTLCKSPLALGMQLLHLFGEIVEYVLEYV